MWLKDNAKESTIKTPGALRGPLEHPYVLMGPPHDLQGPQMQDVIREVKRDKRNSTMTRGAR